MTRNLLTLAVLLIAFEAFAAEPVNLCEESRPGDCSRYQMELSLNGKMFIQQEGRRDPIPLEARARHRFLERTLTVDAGQIRRAVRHYEEARVKTLAGTDGSERVLSPERRLIAVDRRPEGSSCTCPLGLLTREELETVAGHFPPHALPGLLPGKPVAIGDRWTVDGATTQAACLFDGLSKNELTGKLVAVENGRARFVLEGVAEGMEAGAPVKLTITAEGSFDIASQRVITLIWKQKDERGEGPISPASEVEATITLTRETLSVAAAELSDTVISTLPREPDTTLRYLDPRGDYRFDYSRDWHITGETDSHLILRLLNGHELLAQATLMRWKPTLPNQRTGAAEFRQKIAEIPGWAEKSMLEEGEIPVDQGRRLLHHVALGEVEGRPVVQGFHLLSGPQGQQLSATIVMKPEKVKAVAPRDRALVTAILFLEKK